MWGSSIWHVCYAAQIVPMYNLVPALPAPSFSSWLVSNCGIAGQVQQSIWHQTKVPSDWAKAQPNHIVITSMHLPFRRTHAVHETNLLKAHAHRSPLPRPHFHLHSAPRTNLLPRRKFPRQTRPYCSAPRPLPIYPTQPDRGNSSSSVETQSCLCYTCSACAACEAVLSILHFMAHFTDSGRTITGQILVLSH